MEIKILVVLFIIANDFVVVKLDEVRQTHIPHTPHNYTIYSHSKLN